MENTGTFSVDGKPSARHLRKCNDCGEQRIYDVHEQGTVVDYKTVLSWKEIFNTCLDNAADEGKR